MRECECQEGCWCTHAAVEDYLDDWKQRGPAAGAVGFKALALGGKPTKRLPAAPTEGVARLEPSQWPQANISLRRPWNEEIEEKNDAPPALSAVVRRILNEFEWVVTSME